MDDVANLIPRCFDLSNTILILAMHGQTKKRPRLHARRPGFLCLSRCRTSYRLGGLRGDKRTSRFVQEQSVGRPLCRGTYRSFDPLNLRRLLPADIEDCLKGGLRVATTPVAFLLACIIYTLSGSDVRAIALVQLCRPVSGNATANTSTSDRVHRGAVRGHIFLKFSVAKTASIRSALRLVAHFLKDVVLQSFDQCFAVLHEACIVCRPEPGPPQEPAPGYRCSL